MGVEYLDILAVFALNVRKHRRALGLSQEGLAEISGLHRTYISSVERCMRNISLENVQRIADAMKVETYKLFLEENAELSNHEKRGCEPASQGEL